MINVMGVLIIQTFMHIYLEGIKSYIVSVASRQAHPRLPYRAVQARQSGSGQANGGDQEAAADPHVPGHRAAERGRYQGVLRHGYEEV